MTKNISTCPRIVRRIFIYRCPTFMVFNTFLQNVLWQVFCIISNRNEHWIISYLLCFQCSSKRYDVTGCTQVIYVNVILQLVIIRKIWGPRYHGWWLLQCLLLVVLNWANSFLIAVHRYCLLAVLRRYSHLFMLHCSDSSDTLLHVNTALLQCCP